MNYLKAVEIACDYFKNKIGVLGISAASESAEKWYFSLSTSPLTTTLISISKIDYKIETMNMISRTTREELTNSKSIEIPDEYKFTK